MHYRPETLSLYGTLFADAHASFVKEAGVLETMGRAMGRGMRGIGDRLFPTQRRVAQLKQEALAANAARDTAVLKQQQFAQDTIARQAQMEQDIAHMSARRAKLRNRVQQQKQQIASQQAELETLGTTPGGVRALQNRARLGLGLGAAGLAAGPAAYFYGQHQGEKHKNLTRNLAFGAGAATGLAIPTAVRGISHLAHGMGQTGLYPEFQNVPDLSQTGAPDTGAGGY